MSVKILFVCTGNICRSPTAEGVFRHRAAAAGLAASVETGSAGLAGYHVGEPPDRRSVAAARARGYRIDDLRARKVRPTDFQAYDLILAMDRGHYEELRRLAPPDLRDRVRLFLSYAPETGRLDVPDPYYGDQADFGTVLDLVEAGAAGLLQVVRDRFRL